MRTTDHANRRVRTLDEVVSVPRSQVRSLWRSVKEQTADDHPHVALPSLLVPPTATATTAAVRSLSRRLRDRAIFLGKAFLRWAKEFFVHAFRGRQPFPTYPAAENGLYPMDSRVRVALAADWGTGTESAYAVADHIRSLDPGPDFTIHLGDVYYSGTAKEFAEYFLPDNCWPRGRSRTFVMNANHEMYGGGAGYFGDSKHPEGALKRLGQTTSYFCLENRHWRIVALDTGYECSRGGGKIANTLLGWIPGVGLLLRDRTKLHEAELAWLRNTVFVDPTDRRPVVLLTHHQPVSAFETDVYPKLVKQLAPYLDRVAVWIWGHEHKLAGYLPYTVKGATITGRCIGHGGMPIELAWGDVKDAPKLLFTDERRSANQVDGKELGFCGFALADFDDTTLTITYIDEFGTELLRETWVSDDGTLEHSVSRSLDDPFLRVATDAAAPPASFAGSDDRF
jgi:hypothetical protein